MPIIHCLSEIRRSAFNSTFSMRHIFSSLVLSSICLLAMSVLVYAQTEVSGAITQDMTWTRAGSPYQVVGNLTVSQDATLSVKPGVHVRFEEGVVFIVDGGMSAVGTSDDPVIFAGSKQIADWWKGIQIRNSGWASLEHCRVSHSGRQSSFGVQKTGSGNLVVKNSTFSHTRGNGLWVVDNNGDILVEGSIFESNISGIFLNNAGPVTVLDSEFRNNEQYGVVVKPLDGLPTDNSNFFSGNLLADIGVAGGTILKDMTWSPAGAPLRVAGRIVVSKGATLFIEPGVEVQFNPRKDLIVDGGLSAVGTSDEPVIFAGSKPLANWWYGILIRGSGWARLEHCQVSHAGRLRNYGIQKTGKGDLVVKNTIFSHTGGNGLWINDSTGNHVIEQNIFTSNTGGLNVSNQREDIALMANHIQGNDDFGVRNQSAGAITVDARQNWWGDLSGPRHARLNPDGQGDAVSNGVLFDKWLESFGEE